MNSFIWLLIPFCLLTFSLENEPFHYGTSSPEARAAYLKGWEQILDRGEWTLAEASFRQAVALDTGFLLAWSQVGRISKDPEERALIFQQLSDQKSQATGWENKLLEVYLASLDLIDAKDRGLKISPEQVRDFYSISERHFSNFLLEYPGEQAIQSEYIEVIHGIYGPGAALDSMGKLSRLPPFLVSYTAQMQAEKKEFEAALQSASDLENLFHPADLPILSFTYALIYVEMGNYAEAKKSVEKTLLMDQNHTLAQRLKKQMEERSKMP
jgi:tetratricopeptide (TPR) repeat protein